MFYYSLPLFLLHPLFFLSCISHAQPFFNIDIFCRTREPSTIGRPLATTSSGQKLLTQVPITRDPVLKLRGLLSVWSHFHRSTCETTHPVSIHPHHTNSIADFFPATLQITVPMSQMLLHIPTQHFNYGVPPANEPSAQPEEDPESRCSDLQRNFTPAGLWSRPGRAISNHNSCRYNLDGF